MKMEGKGWDGEGKLGVQASTQFLGPPGTIGGPFNASPSATSIHDLELEHNHAL